MLTKTKPTINFNLSIILLIVIVIVIIVLYIYINYNYNYNHEYFRDQCNRIKIDKCFLLTLPKSKERRNKFLKYYNKNLNYPLEIIWGVDTRNEETLSKYKYLINPIKYIDIFNYDKRIKNRPDHTYFNSGAVGAYIGHMQFYIKCFEQNLEYAIIFEDNVLILENINKELNDALSILGDDFDVCFFHYQEYIGKNIIKCNKEIIQLQFIHSAKCYLVNVKSMKKYYNLFYPIDNHIDQIYEKLVYNGANIYLIPFNNIKVDRSNSTINHSPIVNDILFQYLDLSRKDMIVHPDILSE